MNTKEYELNLLNETLQWAKTKPQTAPIIPHYEEYLEKASKHTPIISEDWGKHNLRHGPNSIRGTTSEFMTSIALAVEGYEISQVVDKKEQKYGSDLKVFKGSWPYVFSVKSARPVQLADGEVILKLYREYFDSAEWRVNFLSLVHPESRQLWLINYPLVGNIYCTKNDRGLYTPAFTEQSVAFRVNQTKLVFPNGIQHIDLMKGNQ